MRVAIDSERRLQDDKAGYRGTERKRGIPPSAAAAAADIPVAAAAAAIPAAAAAAIPSAAAAAAAGTHGRRPARYPPSTQSAQCIRPREALDSRGGVGRYRHRGPSTYCPPTSPTVIQRTLNPRSLS